MWFVAQAVCAQRAPAQPLIDFLLYQNDRPSRTKFWSSLLVSTVVCLYWPLTLLLDDDEFEALHVIHGNVSFAFFSFQSSCSWRHVAFGVTVVGSVFSLLFFRSPPQKQAPKALYRRHAQRQGDVVLGAIETFLTRDGEYEINNNNLLQSFCV